MAEEEKIINEEAAEEVKEAAKPKKKPKKNGELEKLKAELEQKDDLLKRTAAEFDNFKRRTEREKAGIAEYAKAETMKKLLPILDNVDRARSFDKESADYIKGIEMIVKQLEGLTEQLGLEEIAEVGDTFDPNYHEALMHIEDESMNENVIAEILQKGYKLGDTVVRAAMVKVAN